MKIRMLLLLVGCHAAPAPAPTAAVRSGPQPARSAPAPVAPAEPRRVMVMIAADGSIFFGEEKLDDVQLRERLSAEVREDPDVQVLIAADGRVTHGVVVHVMEIAKEAGVKKLAIATQ
jgi:biopolymer transport protein ExbD